MYYQHKRPAQWVSESIFSALKGPKLEANLSRQSSDEVKNEQLFISIYHTPSWPGQRLIYVCSLHITIKTNLHITVFVMFRIILIFVTKYYSQTQ